MKCYIKHQDKEMVLDIHYQTIKQQSCLESYNTSSGMQAMNTNKQPNNRYRITSYLY